MDNIITTLNDAEVLINTSDIASLSELTPIEYDKVRQQTADRLGVRVSTLDKEVKAYKKPDSDELVSEVEPWNESVDALQLAEEIKTIFHRYVILPAGAVDALTLWIIGTYSFNAFRIYPKGLITSPEKRCGKSTLLEIFAALVYKPLTASNISAAAVFRVVELVQPTLLIDEADTFLSTNDELRGIINSGHNKAAAHVIRVDGDKLEPKKFSTWSPMVIAMIKKPAGTIVDRSIIIEMRRRLPGETVSKIPLNFSDNCLVLRRKIKRWADDNFSMIKGITPALPKSENDRALDNWTPLFSIAKVFGGEWPALAFSSFHTLNTEDDDDSLGVLLLDDIRNIFATKFIDRIHSAELVQALIELEEKPWSEWRRGKALTVNNLSRLLKPFSVRSADTRIGHKVKRGFKLESFTDAFNRYLPSDTPFQSATALQSNDTNGFSQNESATPKIDVALEKPLKPIQDKGCSTVALKKGCAGEGGSLYTYQAPFVNNLTNKGK